MHLAFVTPDTHHRALASAGDGRLFWRWKSRSRGGRPHVGAEVRELIASMSRDNPLWGTERIRGELLKLGIVVTNRLIRRYRWRGPAARALGRGDIILSMLSFCGRHRDRVCLHRVTALVVVLVGSAAVLILACAPAAPPPHTLAPAAAPTSGNAPTVASPRSAASPTAARASPVPAPSPVAQSTGPVVQVQVGYLNSASDAGIVIGQEKGFFRDQGLDIQLQRFDTGAAMTPLLANGQLDVGAGSPSAGLYNAVARNITIKIVADKGSDRPGFGYQGIALRKDLGERVRSYQDLKGLKVGVTGTGGTSAELVLAQALKMGGLTLKDVDVVAVPYPELNVALRTGALDAAVHFEPLFTVGVKQGLAVDWKRADEIYPNHQSAVIMYGASFIAKSDLARRWMVAYLQGVRYYNDALLKARHKDEVIEILARATGASTEVLAQAVPTGLNPDGYVNSTGLANDIRALATDFGVLTEPVDPSNVIDNSYVAYALQQLGQYQP